MTNEFYEFLFDLRASGFMHNTQGQIRNLVYRMNMAEKSEFKFTAAVSGEVTSDSLDGEVGSFSQKSIRNYQNAVIAIAATSYLTANEYHVDNELACTLSDYYINKSAEIRSAKDFECMVQELMQQFQELIQNSQRKFYGRKVNQCIEYIDQHLYSALTVEGVAEHIGHTPNYVSALFKKKVGMTISKYIQERKIQEAKMLLLSTSRPVAAIADALGYHSVSHFSKAFKAAEGIPPTEYRENIEDG